MLDKEFLNFSTLTDGEALLLVTARNQHLRAMIASRKNQNQRAALHEAAASILRTSVANGLHNSQAIHSIATGNNNVNNALNGLIAKARKRGQGAIRLSSQQLESNGLANLNVDPTPEQRNECRILATNQAQREFAGQPVDNLVLQGRVTTLTNECIRKKEMENIVNAHLEDSGVSFLYTLMPQGVITFNNLVNNKNFQQNAWVAETSKVAGLSNDVVRTICENGVMNVIEETPEAILNTLAPFLEKGSTLSPTNENGEASIFAGAIILIAKIVTAVVIAVRSGISLVDQIKARQQKAYDSIKDPSTFSPAEEDFNNNGIADSQETTLQKIFTPRNIALGVSIFALTDPFKVLPNKTTRNIIAVAGAGYFVYDTFFAPKKWIVNGSAYDAAGMQSIGYVLYENEWYLASAISQRSGLDVQSIIEGGIGLFKTIAPIFKEIKDIFSAGGTDAVESNSNQPIFAGEDVECQQLPFSVGC